MTNEVTTFTTPAELGSLPVRTATVNGNTVWRLDDLCRVQEIANPWDAARRLDEDEKITLVIAEGNRGNPNVTFVTEAGRYSLIGTSRTPRAKPFKRWVNHEVLPSIRKDGGYIMGEVKVRTGEMPEDEMIARALLMVHSKLERITAERDQFANENVQLTARNTVLEHMREFVTVDAYLAEEGLIDGKYKSWQERKNIGIRAAAIARRRGIPLKKQDRWIRKPWGPLYAPVNILPREILAEACAEFGYIKLVVLAA
jgi:prophage antirepressor-like protein